MNRFWDNVIMPVLKLTNAKNIVEIGAQQGKNTVKILPYVKENEGKLFCIDPFPAFDEVNLKENFKGHFELFKELSLSALPKINNYDAIFIDGDHNWYTVINELKIVQKTFKGSEKFPIVFAHDISWPYGRRDLYYNPENIPAYFLQPYKQMGILPESTQLVENGGLNAHLYNSIYENNPSNGVLTAIEDFIEESNRDLIFEPILGFHGLGIIYENTEDNKKIKEFISSLHQNQVIQKLLEEDRIQSLLRINKLREDLHEKIEQIEKLEKEEELLKKELVKEDQTQSYNETREKELSDLIEKINELSAVTEILNKEKQQLFEQVTHMENLNMQMQQEIEGYNNVEVEYKRNRQLTSKQIRDIKYKLEKESKKKQEVYNSIKYRLGDIVISAFKSPKKFILMPYRLVKLLRYALKKKAKKKKSPIKINEKKKSSKKFIITDYKNDLFYQSVKDIVKEGKNANFEHQFQKSEDEVQTKSRNFDNNKKTPLVSIIMPTYNRAKIMGQAIQSIFEQEYKNWELIICDDGSTDNTEKLIKQYKDSRIKYFKLKKGGAAKARNNGLEQAKGEYVAYLDTDNLWHPQYLALSIGTLQDKPGYYSVFSRYIDVVIQNDIYKLKTSRSLSFDYEALTQKNFIDLNSFVHRRELYDNLGGFSEELVRQQDWDLVLKYTFLRDPLYLNQFLVVYRRNKDWDQITHLHNKNTLTVDIVQKNVQSYYKNGLPFVKSKENLPKITIISWDVCRNHFSKAYNIAESLSSTYSVQLLGFRFFEEEIFPPYKDEVPNFEMTIIEGKNFPDLFPLLSEAITKIKGDIIYAVKPRTTSLGVALLANYHLGKPIVLEHNDLESVVSNPSKEQLNKNFDLSKVDLTAEELNTPYSSIWSNIMEEFAHKIPISTTHNINLDNHFGGNSFYIRNLKDETYYNPDNYDRDAIRRELGFAKDDRIILFGGLLRKHKGIFDLVNLLEKLNDDRYKLLFVGSRETPDQKKLIQKYGDKIKVLPPQGRNDMSKINYASDLVILWLNPDVPASHYQMPYKFTDAIAMKVPVIASDISDLEVLAKDNYLRLSRYGDFDGLLNEIKSVFENKEETSVMVERARNLYIRQFSYKAVKSNLDIIFDVAKKHEDTLDASKSFSEFFSDFYQQSTKKENISRMEINK
ncbi:glycosyltransferase [Sutcliffiella horikoshii]|uniref:glycosyltransferase n=1 Tax=Sutcliffiella horikoshii TaxID=79883 RepID=UPI003CFB284A